MILQSHKQLEGEVDALLQAAEADLRLRVREVIVKYAATADQELLRRIAGLPSPLGDVEGRAQQGQRYAARELDEGSWSADEGGVRSLAQASETQVELASYSKPGPKLDLVNVETDSDG